jgi:hypothetical protein
MTTKEVVENWHLDKKVPIALLVALCLQFGGMAMYVSSLKFATDNNDRRISVLESQKVSERLASLESQVSDTKALLNRMDAKIDRINERVK